MARRNNSPTETKADARRRTTPPSAITTDAMEQRLMAFAAQLGRVAGAFQAKAEGWVEHRAVQKQIASVRDGAADLLEQLAGGAATFAQQTRAGSAPGASRRRSGGVVDAPGKKHRPLVRSEAGANLENSQAAKLRAARTMIKTSRRRGRG